MEQIHIQHHLRFRTKAQFYYIFETKFQFRNPPFFFDSHNSIYYYYCILLFEHQNRGYQICLCKEIQPYSRILNFLVFPYFETKCPEFQVTSMRCRIFPLTPVYYNQAIRLRLLNLRLVRYVNHLAVFFTIFVMVS